MVQKDDEMKNDAITLYLIGNPRNGLYSNEFEFVLDETGTLVLFRTEDEA